MKESSLTVAKIKYNKFPNHKLIRNVKNIDEENYETLLKDTNVEPKENRKTYHTSWWKSQDSEMSILPKFTYKKFWMQSLNTPKG